MNLKLQLGDFDRYFSLRLENGLRLYAHQPILKFKDLQGLIGEFSEPVKDDSGDTYPVLLEKLYLPEIINKDSHDIPVMFKFRSGKLASIYVEKDGLDNLDENFLIKSLRALGTADVQKRKKLVRGEFVVDPENPVRIPTLSDIRTILGNPYYIKARGTDRFIRYRYSMKSTPENKNPKKMSVWFIFSEHGELKAIEGNIKGVRIRVMYIQTSGT